MNYEKSAALLNTDTVCKKLKICHATLNNWIKLDKIRPTVIKDKQPFFSEEYLADFQKSLASDTDGRLKSRRNKNYVLGKQIYTAYLSEDSRNLVNLLKIFEIIERDYIKINDALMLALIANTAIKMLLDREHHPKITYALKSYYDGKMPQGQFWFLIDNLLMFQTYLEYHVDLEHELFSLDFIYEPNEDILGFLYLSFLEIKSRKAQGAYYTPNAIVKKLCEQILSDKDYQHKTFLDPCCGTGNFFLQLPTDIPYTQIYGYDIDPISIDIARLNFALKYKVCDSLFLEKHIRVCNYLKEHTEEFDFIIGNPPWGFEFEKSDTEYLREHYAILKNTKGKVESFDVFLEKAVCSLKDGGTLAFVLPESLLNVKSHEPIRRFLLAKTLLKTINYLGDPFKNIQCPCIILEVTRSDSKNNLVGFRVFTTKGSFTVKTEREISSDCFCLALDDDEYRLIRKIETLTPSFTLKGQADFALGIVTGDNARYLSDKKELNQETIVCGRDLHKYRFEKNLSFIHYTPQNFQQVSDDAMYRASEKLLYRFICATLVFSYDNEKTLTLNSCNILIPRVKNVNIKYILALLNSRVLQFYFQKKFNSVKVLRSHLERLPMPLADDNVQNKIIRLMQPLLDSEKDKDKTKSKKEILCLYDRLDECIAKLYGLDSSEYAKIKLALADLNLYL